MQTSRYTIVLEKWDTLCRYAMHPKAIRDRYTTYISRKWDSTEERRRALCLIALGCISYLHGVKFNIVESLASWRRSSSGDASGASSVTVSSSVLFLEVAAELPDAEGLRPRGALGPPHDLLRHAALDLVHEDDVGGRGEV